MEIKEAIALIDNIVFEQEERYLDDLEKDILHRIYQGDSYFKIAEDVHKSEGRIKNIASEIWKILSKHFGKPTKIRRSNFKSELERLHISNISNGSQVINNSKNVNVCSNTCPYSEIQNTPSPPEQKNINLPIQDLKKAPIIKSFYGRSTEINTLKDYIFNQKYNLISILGILGIGKTTLIGKLVDEIKAEFEIVIWHNIESNKSLNDTLTQILNSIDNTQEIPQTIEDQQNLLIEILEKQKCLLIFDEIQNLFSHGKYSGNYETEHINYKTLWSKIIKEHHQSCVILISDEKSKEIAEIELNQPPVGILELKGLKEDEGKELLKEKKLTDENYWNKLINMYQGNPLWLNYITIMINEVCDGRVGEFVEDNQINLPDDLAIKINEIYQRLSEIEKQILGAIAASTLPLTIAQLQQCLSISKSNILNGIQSLIRRYLVVKIAEKETRYNILEILREFIISK